MQFSKLIVTIVVLLNIVFAGIILYMVWHGRPEPAVLVGAWFAFTTGELWMLSKIKRAEKGEGEVNAKGYVDTSEK